MVCMGHMSNRERIARAAEEARLADKEKVAKKEAKASSPKPTKRAVKTVRMKVVWEVCSPTGAVVKAFSYPDRAAADTLNQELTRSTGRTHMVRGTKVPME